MKRIIAVIASGDNLTIHLLVISAVSLFLSFLNISVLGIDAAWGAIILCGTPIVQGAVTGLLREFDIKADLLVSIALIASVIIGEIFAAGEVAFIMTLGALLEERTVAKARAGIEKLVRLSPRTARVIRDGDESIVLAEQVQVGDILRVLAGETVAVDGVIVTGKTAIDQSVMTGESMPLDKGPGDEVYSGTVNQFGTFDMEAVKGDEDSSLQRMIRLVESADAGKAKIVGMADRWATWIVIIALAAAGGTWFFTGEIIRAVTILVVFCPCALVLATPTAIMAGIGNAAKFGILIREGDALERLSQVNTVAFDKTGTLTYGKPVVVAAKSFFEDISPERLMALAATAELRSEHPLGKAIVSHYKTTTDAVIPDPVDFEMLPGLGVKAAVGGHYVIAGTSGWLSDNASAVSQEMLIQASEYTKDGCTVIYIGVDGRGTGFVVLSDTLRKDAADMVHSLKAVPVECVLLTGDNPQAAAHIAARVGITHVHSGCLPEDKLTAIERYEANNERVCMVGDGINDAPALKKAHVGIAMGGIGSDIAVEAADITLVGDSLRHIPHLLSLARKTLSTIRLNLALSMFLNFAAIILAMTGMLNPVLGALVHNVGSVAVIINSAVLLRYKSASSGAQDQAQTRTRVRTQGAETEA